MFNKAEAAAYQSITAPAELRDKVLEAAQKAEKFRLVSRQKHIRAISSVAACLLLAVAIFVYPFVAQNKITVNGDKLTSSGIVLNLNQPVAASTRSADSVTVEINVSAKNIDDVAVSHGSVESGENTTLVWVLELTDTDAEPTLTFSKNNRIHTVTLKFDTADELWKVFRS